MCVLDYEVLFDGKERFVCMAFNESLLTRAAMMTTTTAATTTAMRKSPIPDRRIPTRQGPTTTATPQPTTTATMKTFELKKIEINSSLGFNKLGLFMLTDFNLIFS